MAKPWCRPKASTEWKPLATSPEFAPLLAPQPAPPGATIPPVASTAAFQPAASSRVQGPAIALIIVAALNFVLAVVALIMNVAGGQMRQFPPTGNPELEKLLQSTSGIAGAIFNVISMGIAAVILVGALKMKNLQNYGLAMAATILAMIPCLSPCCLIGLPIGIWSLVMLLKPEVKTAFH